MLKSLKEPQNDSVHIKELHPIFLRSPVEFYDVNNELKSVRFAINRLRGETIEDQVAEMTDEFEEIPCGLALRSIGYKSVQISGVPFNSEKGYLKNTNGKIEGPLTDLFELSPLYAAGWAATGPTGIILTTMTNAFQVARLIYNELPSKPKGSDAKSRVYQVMEQHPDLKIQPVSYKDWLKIDRVEQERGRQLGKVREKIVDIKEMLEIAAN